MVNEERLVEVYEQMLARPEEEREGFLLRELPSPAARELVEALFAHERAQAEGQDPRLGEEDYDKDEHADRRALLDLKIGAYQPTRILGHGGSATVFLADRCDRRYSAQVAIKILDTFSAGAGGRMQTELQILADLTHPDIARILDAGELADGRPYFIMEYVRGMPLDHYCDQHRLGIAERLKLFLRVCVAVQFAHQRLVIHRDLKPVNILVDEEGSPKLLDFGIATLLNAADPTRTGAFAAPETPHWTREFASPEQIRGEKLTTASDVYSLGVILYGLLTGLPVRDEQDGEDPSAQESALNTEPEAASRAVRQAHEDPRGQGLMEVFAQARGLTARKLSRRLEGDLDAILRRALRTDPAVRYESVEQLAADIRRYLRHEVVQAREGNWLYAAGRFIWKHYVSMAAATVFAAVLIGGVTALLVQNQRIRAEHARAEKVSEFMLNVFSAADPFLSHGKQMTAGELLDQAGRRILTDPALQETSRADLLQGIGRAYRRQDLSQESLPYLTEALRLRTEVLAHDSLPLASLNAELALAFRSIGRLEDSESAFDRAKGFSEQDKEAQSPARVHLLTEIGRLEVMKGRLGQAQQHFDEALKLAQQLLGPRHAEVASIQLDRANLAFLKDDHKNAVQWAQQAVTLNAQLLPLHHPDRVMSQYILASILSQSDDPRRAEQLFEQVLPAQRKLYGHHSPKVADTLDAMAELHRRQGHHLKAEQYSREALQVQLASPGADHFMVGYFRVQLALSLFDQGRYAQANQELVQAIAIYQKTLPADHEFLAAAEHWRGEVALAQGQLEVAADVLEHAIGRWRRAGAPAWRVARSQSTLGVVYSKLSDCERAHVLLKQSVQTLSADVNTDPKTLELARRREQLPCTATRRGEAYEN